MWRPTAERRDPVYHQVPNHTPSGSSIHRSDCAGFTPPCVSQWGEGDADGTPKPILGRSWLKLNKSHGAQVHHLQMV